MHRRPTPADLIVVGNHPWPGDPMQSFKVLLHHRAACRSGGVLVGLFWTDSAGDRPLVSDRAPCGGSPRQVSLGAGQFDDCLPVGSPIVAAWGSPAAFMLRWACELVVDRTVLVYSPPLYAPTRASAGSVRPFRRSIGTLASAQPRPSLDGNAGRAGSRRVRVFPQGGLTYVTESTTELINKLRLALPLRRSSRAWQPSGVP